MRNAVFHSSHSTAWMMKDMDLRHITNLTNACSYYGSVFSKITLRKFVVPTRSVW